MDVQRDLDLCDSFVIKQIIKQPTIDLKIFENVLGVRAHTCTESNTELFPTKAK